MKSSSDLGGVRPKPPCATRCEAPRRGATRRAPATRAARSLASIALLALLLSACTTPARAPTAPEPAESEPSARAADLAPSWVGEPLSWQKLAEIETWLAAQEPDSESYWVLEGELQLNQGRLDLAQSEKSGEKLAPAALKARVRTARAGLERVAANEEASAGQRKRAKAGIARADRLLDKKAGVTSASASGLGVKVIPRTTWGAKQANAARMDKNQGGWKRITVHHSAERHPPALDGSQAASAAAVRSIQKAHVEGRETGFGDIGYHFVVDPYGRVFQGRDLVWQGAHAAGSNNVQNIGVCLIGNFDEERPTSAALDALATLLDELRKKHTIARSQVLSHGDLKKTDCPGKHLEPWVKRYARPSS